MSDRPPNLNGLYAGLLANLPDYFIVERRRIKTNVGGDEEELCFPIIHRYDSVKKLIVDPIGPARAVTQQPLRRRRSYIDFDNGCSKSGSLGDRRLSGKANKQQG